MKKTDKRQRVTIVTDEGSRYQVYSNTEHIWIDNNFFYNFELVSGAKLHLWGSKINHILVVQGD